MKHRRILLVVILLAGILLPVMAADPPPATKATDVEYKQVAEPFIGTSVRVQGMGGAGLGVKGYHDSFLFNPANLAGSGFKLSLPSITVTAFNPKKILESGAIDEFEKGGDAGMISGAQKLLGVIGKGYGDFLTTDVSTTFTLGGFGLSLQMQERMMTYKAGADLTGTNLIAQVTAAATAGFGMTIRAVPRILDIDLGVSVQAVYKGYLKAISADTLTDMLADDDADPGEIFLNKTPLMGGWAVPISIGANFNFPYGLSLSTVARNINGKYYMTTYASANDWAEELFGARLTDDTATGSAKLEEWTMESDWGLDFGFTWAPTFLGNLVKPTIAIDVVDVVSMGGKKGDDLTRAFFEQTRLGASVRLLSLLDVRYGINKGYQSIGVGFDLLVFHIDANYYTSEYGASLGDKPIDALSLRFSIGSK
jgi:hypothetical protein